MLENNSKPLFIFEMANNHYGDVEHAINILNEVKKVCKDFSSDFDFAFKLQYRELDTFIHNDYKNSSEIKFIKRFSETRLNDEQYKLIKDEMEKLGFITICTPFDEESVNLIIKHNFDYIKIASCSCNDWPLLEKIAEYNKPVIISTAGIDLNIVSSVVQFFTHRDISVTLMHCVAEYPTSVQNLQLNQIDLLKKLYPEITIGYSTHERPDNYDSVKIAIGKGAKVFEKHVALKTDKYPVNAYSIMPEQIKFWLQSAKEAFSMCGTEGKRYEFLPSEIKDLTDLKRAVFAKKPIKKGDKIDTSNTFLAIPSTPGQVLANDFSKYTKFYATEDIAENKAVMSKAVQVVNIREKIENTLKGVQKILKESKVALCQKSTLELSFHYGFENFDKYGAVIISCINREYCKKIIILLPGQTNPTHSHKIKEETFYILHGNVSIIINGEEKEYKPGDIVLVERGAPHSFSTQEGVVMEEISTTHYKSDSYYEDEAIAGNPDRKMELIFWTDIA